MMMLMLLLMLKFKVDVDADIDVHAVVGAAVDVAVHVDGVVDACGMLMLCWPTLQLGSHHAPMS